MARGRVIWISALILGSAFAQPLPDPQFGCGCLEPVIPVVPVAPCYEPLPLPEPLPPCPCSLPEQVIDIGPCNPCEQPVNFVYGQAPPGTLVVKPGQVRFPTPPPLVVRPGQVRFPRPPQIWVKPNAVQPPTPAPITVKPAAVQPPTPPPFCVPVPPVQPPTPPPIVVRPPPVPVPRPPPMKVQPAPVPVPPPGSLVVLPPRITVPSPPVIAFHPNPPSVFRVIGSARVDRAGQNRLPYGPLLYPDGLPGTPIYGSPSGYDGSGGWGDNSGCGCNLVPVIPPCEFCAQPVPVILEEPVAIPEFVYPPPCPCML